jgi:hypothetical protein
MGNTVVDSSNFTVAGVSGADYETAFAPEPGTAAVLVLGLGALAYRKRGYGLKTR